MEFILILAPNRFFDAIPSLWANRFSRFLHFFQFLWCPILLPKPSVGFWFLPLPNGKALHSRLFAEKNYFVILSWVLLATIKTPLILPLLSS